MAGEKTVGRTVLSGVFGALLGAVAVIAILWGLFYVTSFERSDSRDAGTFEERAEWLEYQRLPSATLVPPPAGEPASASLVYTMWTQSHLMFQPSRLAFHLVARVPPDSLDVWRDNAFTYDGTAWDVPLEANASPDLRWLGTLPPGGPPTDGLSEWYGDERVAVGLDRARGIVAYRLAVHGEYQTEPWWTIGRR